MNLLVDAEAQTSTTEHARTYFRGCEVDAEGRAVIQLAAPHHATFDLMDFAVLPEHAYGPEFALAPVGTGPMAFVRMGRGELLLEAYPNGHHAPEIDRVRIAEVTDPVAALRLLQDGEVHGVVEVDPTLWPDVVASETMGMKTYRRHAWWFIALDTERGPLAETSVRHALEAAIDRERLQQRTLPTDENDPSPPVEFISGPFVQASPNYNRDEAVSPTRDLDKVAEHMGQAKARLRGGSWRRKGKPPVTLRMGLLHDHAWRAPGLVDELVAQLGEAGFAVQPRQLDAAESAQARRGELADELDMLVGSNAHGAYETLDPLFHTRVDGHGKSNFFGLSDPETDRLLKAHEDARTDTEAQAAYHALHTHLATVRSHVFLWQQDSKSAWRWEVRRNIVGSYYYFQEFGAWTLEPRPAPQK